MKSLQTYTFWFVVGSQDLYGEDVLKTVDAHTKEMVNEWNKDATIPCEIVWKSVVRNQEEIYQTLTAANEDDSCAGVITWMHTFSPSKMWIRGFRRFANRCCI